MASRTIVPQQPRGEAVVGGGKQHLKKNGVADGRNRKALGDIGNLANVRGVVVEAKPNRPITRSFGAQLLAQLLANAQARARVFDLGEQAPEKVLRTVYANLESLNVRGDQFANEIRERLKLIVAKVDGTAGWLLGVVCNLILSHPPPIAMMPLGTGNNLPFAFGWGKKNPTTDQASVEAFLDQVMKAKEMKIDK